jgi:hypothetical protein
MRGERQVKRNMEGKEIYRRGREACEMKRNIEDEAERVRREILEVKTNMVGEGWGFKRNIGGKEENGR